MSSQKSQRLNLHLWEPDDNFLRTEFNENFTALDTAVKAGEQEQAQLESSLNSLKTEVSSVKTTANSAKTTAEAAYCATQKPYVVGSYLGTGKFGYENPTVINVGFKPSFLIAFGPESSFAALPGRAAVSNAGNTITWLSTGASWYSKKDAASQVNTSGNLCFYIAFR